MAESKEEPKLLMIPGPTEFDDEVVRTLSKKCDSHVAPAFIEIFGACLDNMRKVFLADRDTQPFILSGGGSLGWDCIAASLCEPNDRALVLNTGYFGDNFTRCLEAYGVEVDQVFYPIGEAAQCEDLEKALKKREYKLLTITHVDTSTAVANNVKALAECCRRASPNTLIAVDGVCSFAAEEFAFSRWGIDAAMTASQKALGAPPGLAILMLSNRAVQCVTQRKSQIRSFYGNLANWLPIMRAYEARKVSYFSTPNVSLIKALYVASEQILTEGMDKIFARHLKQSKGFQAAMKALGLSFVALRDENLAVTLSAVKFPAGVQGSDFLKYVKEKGVIFAGGLHKDIKKTYFRCGHMGVSTKDGRKDVLKSVEAVEYALAKCGYKFEKNVGLNAYKKSVAEFSKL